ncbi:ABC-2 transporter permease [Saccharibacillus alkalitolerans]|uniref:ABC-2 transporter permease n=1 Tax=Saccharibacillus alkalitolerans TaxID=2705290 RepID=A0ABX0F9V5_9BACL|nr:ABC-2 transporter permease [Saccharibacillus alkalitolerans]NGZ77723.1 ABC-2 transporter permease [Saccharibacillus alkalitolerans]
MLSVVYLIRKDILLVYRYMLLLLPFFLYMAWAQIGTLLVYVTVPAIFMLITSCTFDMQNTNPRFTASLPVSRTQVVLSKYASLAPFTLIGLLFAAVLQGGAALLNLDAGSFRLTEIALVIAINVAVASLYLPLYFWLGPKGMQIVRLVFIMIVAIGSSTLGALSQRSDLLQRWLGGSVQGAGMIWGTVCLALVVLLGASVFLSLKLYAKQDI